MIWLIAKVIGLWLGYLGIKSEKTLYQVLGWILFSIQVFDILLVLSAII